MRRRAKKSRVIGSRKKQKRPKRPVVINWSGEYTEHREAARRRQAELSESGRNIGELPAVIRPGKKRVCKRDLRRFLLSYFLEAFPLPFSADHLKVIAKIQTAVLGGGLFAIAMPRGSGKSTICERAALWALLYGHRRFVVLISAEAGLARDSLGGITSELENNGALLGDFPEVCYPIVRLEGIHQRAAGQLYRGERTQITLTDDEIVLPTIDMADPDAKRKHYSLASGGRVRVAGITGRVRGMKATTHDGAVIRPDLVLVDDPQTDESARSMTQCEERERVLKRAILGLAGPGKRIAGLAAVTVVRQDDLADRLLDREKHPQWQGERTKTVYCWGKAEPLWLEYVELRRRAQREHDAAPEVVSRICNEFYASRRAAMDEGAQVAWESRKEPEDLSALQHAWNIRADRGDAAFASEYQNEPMPDVVLTDDQLTEEALEKRCNGHDRGTVPIECSLITAMVDVQQKALWYAAVAWEPDYTGYVIDYGIEPDQGTDHYTLADLRKTLQLAEPSAGLEGQLRAGLVKLTKRILAKEWRRDDGAHLRIERCFVDANWGQSTDLVYQFCRESEHAAVLIPSHGKYVGAASKPLNEYQRKPGDRVGVHWRVPVGVDRRAVRHVVYDTNWWKSFVRSRLQVPLGDPGCLTLFGHNPETHRLLIDHLVSEHSIRTEGRGRQVDEWRMRMAGLDNHWWDDLVGCAVAASMHGTQLKGDAPASMPRPAKRRTLGELQAATRGN